MHEINQADRLSAGQQSGAMCKAHHLRPRFPTGYVAPRRWVAVRCDTQTAGGRHRGKRAELGTHTRASERTLSCREASRLAVTDARDQRRNRDVWIRRSSIRACGRNVRGARRFLRRGRGPGRRFQRVRGQARRYRQAAQGLAEHRTQEEHLSPVTEKRLRRHQQERSLGGSQRRGGQEPAGLLRVLGRDGDGHDDQCRRSQGQERQARYREREVPVRTTRSDQHRWFDHEVGEHLGRGNDAGFGDVGKACAAILVVQREKDKPDKRDVYSVGKLLGIKAKAAATSSGACAAKISGIKSDVLDGDPNASDKPCKIESLLACRLRTLYKKILDRSPSARLGVVGYPHIFPSDASNGPELKVAASALKANDIDETATRMCATNVYQLGYNLWFKRQSVTASVGIVDKDVPRINQFVNDLNQRAMTAIDDLRRSGYASRVGFVDTNPTAVTHDCDGSTADVSVNGLVISQSGLAGHSAARRAIRTTSDSAGTPRARPSAQRRSIRR